MDVNELFRYMTRTPIQFENADDFNQFLTIIKRDYMHHWWHMAGQWEWSSYKNCIGMNLGNQQISHLESSNISPRKNATIPWSEIKHLFDIADEQQIDVNDLL